MYRVVEMLGDNEPWWFFENEKKIIKPVNSVIPTV